MGNLFSLKKCVTTSCNPFKEITNI
jgi:hypothetical protein